MKHAIVAAWVALWAFAINLRDWPVLQLGAWNIGSADDFPVEAETLDALALNEAADQWDDGGMMSKVRAAGYRLITGRRPGQPATPLAYSPLTLDLVRVRRYLLAARQPIGPGAGPDTLRDKWAIGGKFRHRPTGRLIELYAVHYVASQQRRRRLRVALAMTHRLLLLGKRLVRPVFVLGDVNSDAERGRIARLFVRAGWLINHLVGRRRRTHDVRAIDWITWQPRRWIRFLGHRAVATQSDHRLVVGEFAIKPRKRKRKP